MNTPMPARAATGDEASLAGVVPPASRADAHGDAAPASRWRSWLVLARLRALPWPFLLAATVVVGLLILHTLRFPRFFFDDAFISLRYADRLRDGHGLTWTDGERVEGTSNFLWVVAIAALGLFNRGLINPTRVLGVVATSVGIVALMWAHRERSWTGLIRPWFAGLAVAVLGPVAAWAVGGLETPFVLAGLGLSLVLAFAVLEREKFSWRVAIGLGAALSMLSLTRPDTTLFTATVCAGLVLARPLHGPTWKAAVVAGALSSLSFAALSLFRLAYYGAWVPNTSSKLAFSAERWEVGRAYLTRDYALWLPLMLLAGLGVVFAVAVPATRRRTPVLVLSMVVWLVYVAAIGGDFMPERRHLVPALFLLAAMAAEGISVLSKASPKATLAAWYLGLASCGLVAWQQRDDWAVQDANNGDWYWNARPIGNFMRDAFGDRDPLLAVDAAGALPYFSQLRVIDMLGLNDRFLATHPPPEYTTGSPGHGLGNGAYVLSRKPDLVVFHVPDGREQPPWRSGKEMVPTAEFKSSYQLLYYATPVDHVEGVAYVRFTDSKLAPEWHNNELRLPAFLFATQKKARVTLDPQGRQTITVPEKSALVFARAELRKGSCTAYVDGSDALAVVLRAGSDTWAGEPGGVVEFALDAPRTVRVEVLAKDRAGAFHAVVVSCS